MITPQIVLASSSPYRRELLDKLGISYQCHSPDIDESAHTNETPKALVSRLAKAKAKAVAKHYPNALIIGSDQIAVLDQQIITKPLDHAQATTQLQKASGRTVTFLTSLCLYNSADQSSQDDIVTFNVHFLELSARQIERYLQKEQPYDCAGSFKSEGLGITLFKQLEGTDPNALIGLPLIRLTAMLRKQGLDPLS